MKQETVRLIKEHSAKFATGNHDIGHYERSEVYARSIWKGEGEKADLEVVLASILLHDIGRSIDHSDHPRIGAKMAVQFLGEIGFPGDKLDQVYSAILHHDEFNAQTTLEEQIVYDADRLDALSVHGLFRCAWEHLFNLGNTDLSLGKMTDDIFDYLFKAHPSLNTETAKMIAAPWKALHDQMAESLLRERTGNLSLAAVL